MGKGFLISFPNEGSGGGGGRVVSTRYQYQYHIPSENYGGGRGGSGWRGPRKVASFCLLAVLLPCSLVSIALLMRFVIHGKADYHLAPSDMRILDHKISTIWCQSEHVKGNATFTAYLTHGEPEMIESSEPLLVERNMIVPDDHKEYWGFYLLKGSTFRVHTCARFKGGTLLIVRGRSHLEHCAYIGEADSAGNSDEFSSSNSREGGETGTNGTVRGRTQSREEMHNILTKIRHYIKTKPNNYGRLRENLVNWMLLNSSELVTPPEPQNATLRKEVVLGEEHGTLLRRRRGVLPELREKTESGENAAFEETDNADLPEGKPKRSASSSSSPTKHSIWSEEHQDEHGILPQLTEDGSGDGSDSESESSWSSSEEAMARCEGVVASFTLKADDSCGLEGEEGNASAMNFYEGVVNSSGYYYFIFGSENEKRDNILRTRFLLDKFIYDLPPPIEDCRNVKECRVNFTFGSDEKLVITVPQPQVSLEWNWNEEYVAESECLPRTNLYLLFVILVPLIILLCAFQ